jgi:hypothetical protein
MRFSHAAAILWITELPLMDDDLADGIPSVAAGISGEVIEIFRFAGD